MILDPRRARVRFMKVHNDLCLDFKNQMISIVRCFATILYSGPINLIDIKMDRNIQIFPSIFMTLKYLLTR